MQASVDVVVVNYNAGEVLAECVNAVLQSKIVATLTVVDNASSDGSMKPMQARSAADPRVKLVFNDSNPGFARAVNGATAGGGHPFVLVLNPDCVVRLGAIEKLAQALLLDSSAALAGPWVTDPHGKVQPGTWRSLPNPRNSFMKLSRLGRIFRRSEAFAEIDHGEELPPGAPVRAEAVSGACMMVRRSVGERLAWFDERYAMHCEDLDLMHRIKGLGFHCVLVPGARATHVQGVSSARRPFWVHLQKHKGMQRYFRKFQACEYSPVFRGIVYTGIWLHYLTTLPVVALAGLKSVRR